MEGIDKNIKSILEKQQYRVIGRHSAVKICAWTRKSIVDKGFCYKQKFYGIECHRCLQMTPAVCWCTQKCLFCWRNTEQTIGTELKEYDEPAYIIDEAIKAQRLLLTGFGGLPEDKVNKRKYREAQNPNQAAISLSGEPTIYPKIGELIEEFDSRGFTTFLVTNGTLPERLINLKKMPTQLYLSMDAPTEKIYNKVCNPLRKNNWEKINETIKLFPKLNTRKAVRITAVKGLNMVNPEEYSKLLLTAEPDYIEVKSYMFVGGSRMRLSFENMPTFPEIQSFAEEISKHTGYKIRDYKRDSRVVLLTKK